MIDEVGFQLNSGGMQKLGGTMPVICKPLQSLQSVFIDFDGM